MREASPLDELGDAAREHRVITFTYGADGELGARRAEPYRLVVHKSRTFILAWDLERDDWRMFRTDRMAGLAWQHDFDPRDIPGDAAAIHQDDSTPPIRTELMLDAPLSTAADRLLTQEVELESLASRRCVAHLWGHSYEWIAAIVLSMGVDFTIVGPDEFRAHCQTLRDRLDRAVREEL